MKDSDKSKIKAILQDTYLMFDIFHNKKSGKNTNITKSEKDIKLSRLRLLSN